MSDLRSRLRMLLTVVCVPLVAAGALAAAPGSATAGSDRSSTATSPTSRVAEHGSEAGPRACRRQRHRLVRARHRVHRLRSDLRSARARGNDRRVRRLRAEVRRATARRAELRRTARLACDRQGPGTRIAGGPAAGALVRARRVPFRFASGAADVWRYECSLDGRAWTTCATRADSLAVIDAPMGAHTLRVRAVDRAGNADRTPAARAFSTRYFTFLEAGGDRTCGIRPDGVVRCWGQAFPGAVQAPAGSFDSLAVGAGDTACAVRTADRGVVCWGADGAGQASPPAGTTAGPSGRVYVGRDHACVDTGCWGDGSDGATTVPAGYTVVGAGDDYSCGVQGRAVACWGDDTGGKASPPAEVTFVSDVGPDRACGGYSDPFNSYLVCWGEPLGGPDVDNISWDFQRDISVGGDHACAWGDFITCWGDDAYGQTTVPAVPASLATPPLYGRTTAGRNHTCALRSDSATVCWGDDAEGQATPAVP